MDYESAVELWMIYFNYSTKPSLCGKSGRQSELNYHLPPSPIFSLLGAVYCTCLPLRSQDCSSARSLHGHGCRTSSSRTTQSHALICSHFRFLMALRLLTFPLSPLSSALRLEMRGVGVVLAGTCRRYCIVHNTHYALRTQKMFIMYAQQYAARITSNSSLLAEVVDAHPSHTFTGL